jgi:dipeptidase D
VTQVEKEKAVQNAFDGLEPKVLWKYFDAISQIPRCSGQEERILGYLTELAGKRGLTTRRDTVGNLVIVLPASPGCEKSPTVVLQGHVDMVCEKNRDVTHDFEKDGIPVVRDGDWITARGTTLGADNGVALSSMLALLDQPPARHGALELLFTVDEERGLTGAGGIEPHMLDGRVLLNLDSEEEGFVTVGCAGGGDTVIALHLRREAAPAGWEPAQLQVRGLRGGHSGIDIHENRANSLRCLGRVLDRMGRELGGLRLGQLEGGSKRNAIPREASALIWLPAGSRAQAERATAAAAADLRAEFGSTDPELEAKLDAPPAQLPQPFSAEDTTRALTLLLAIPTGVLAMNRSIPGLVETSTNLGVVEGEDDVVRFISCTRSSLGAALEGARQGLRALGESVGAEVSLEPRYPGWNPNLESRLLARFKEVHEKVTGQKVKVMAIHAGLECGILGERFPGMDMISFGPDLKGVHAPGEQLSIPSTERFFKLLKELLVALT